MDKVLRGRVGSSDLCGRQGFGPEKAAGHGEEGGMSLDRSLKAGNQEGLMTEQSISEM
jgi:hypothetical protein